MAYDVRLDQLRELSISDLLAIERYCVETLNDPEIQSAFASNNDYKEFIQEQCLMEVTRRLNQIFPFVKD